MSATLWLPIGVSTYCVVAAVVDARTGRIPNALTYPGIGCGLALGLWPGLGPELAASLAGLFIVFVPALALFALSGIGGGDVKLLAAVGALVGYPLVVDVVFYAIVAGCALGLIVIIWQRRVLTTLAGLWQLLKSLFYPGMAKIVPATDLQVPFAVAVAIGTAWALLVPALRDTPAALGG